MKVSFSPNKATSKLTNLLWFTGLKAPTNKLINFLSTYYVIPPFINAMHVILLFFAFIALEGEKVLKNTSLVGNLYAFRLNSERAQNGT